MFAGIIDAVVSPCFSMSPQPADIREGGREGGKEGVLETRAKDGLGREGWLAYLVVRGNQQLHILPPCHGLQAQLDTAVVRVMSVLNRFVDRRGVPLRKEGGREGGREGGLGMRDKRREVSHNHTKRKMQRNPINTQSPQSLHLNTQGEGRHPHPTSLPPSPPPHPSPLTRSSARFFSVIMYAPLTSLAAKK